MNTDTIMLYNFHTVSKHFFHKDVNNPVILTIRKNSFKYGRHKFISSHHLV